MSPCSRYPIQKEQKQKHTNLQTQSLNRRPEGESAISMQREIFEKKKKNLFQQNMGRDRKNERPQSAGNALQSNFKSFFFPPPRDRFAFSRVKFPFHYPPRILFSRILSLPREIVQKNRQFGGLRLYIIIGRTKGETPRER